MKPGSPAETTSLHDFTLSFPIITELPLNALAHQKSSSPDSDHLLKETGKARDLAGRIRYWLPRNTRLANALTRRPVRSPRTRSAGVSNRVSKVANASPPAMALDS